MLDRLEKHYKMTILVVVLLIVLAVELGPTFVPLRDDDYEDEFSEYINEGQEGFSFMIRSPIPKAQGFKYPNLTDPPSSSVPVFSSVTGALDTSQLVSPSASVDSTFTSSESLTSYPYFAIVPPSTFSSATRKLNDKGNSYYDISEGEEVEVEDLDNNI